MTTATFRSSIAQSLACSKLQLNLSKQSGPNHSYQVPTHGAGLANDTVPCSTDDVTVWNDLIIMYGDQPTSRRRRRLPQQGPSECRVRQPRYPSTHV